MAQHYKGNPENFRRDQIGKPHVPAKPSPPKEKLGPKTDGPVPGGGIHKKQTPTPQRNDPIILESIFGVDVHVPIHLGDNFDTNFSKLPKLAEETYHAYQPDEKQLDRVIIKEEMAYYSTGLMWLRLLDIKAKQGRQALSSAEKDIRKATLDVEFNVPQQIHAYLSQIGTVTDKMGKETEVDIPPLPQAVAQGFGGYHSQNIDVNTHNPFEEVPSLGVGRHAYGSRWTRRGT